VEEVEAVCARIRRLDPRPGWRYGAANIQYLTPDVIVRKVRGQWTAMLNEAVVPRVRLNRSYAEMFRRHRGAEHAALGAHLQEARWTVRNVEQRFSTILAVAQAILKRQHRFLAYGAMAMKPLALREIAQEVGVHESTVSRVTNNKFMTTPLGVFELKYFFSRALTTESGKTCSGTALRSLIKDMIEAEKPDNPLSDADIARLLAKQGVRLARRTVTKYRQLLRIDPIERRRGRVAHA
jgi:RNA polymerase sigma-54 factor